MADRFESVPQVIERLRTVDYLSDASIAGVVFLADKLGKPVEEVYRFYHEGFIELFKQIGISYDLYTTTHSENHFKVSQTIFLALQKNLSEIEDQVQQARRYYNAVVRDLNTRVAQFPSNLLAGAFGFGPREFFELADPSEGAVPTIDLGKRS